MSITYPFFTLLSAKLLVATGTPETFEYDLLETEIIDLINPTANCESWAYPNKSLAGAAGGMMPNGRLVVCGGFVESASNLNNLCYLLGPKSVNIIAELNESAFASAALVVNNSLWVTGGFHGKI